MKKLLLSIALVMMVCPLYAEWDALQLGTSMQLHRDMLKLCSLDAPQRAAFRMVEARYCIFSAFEGEDQITVFARDEERNYLLHGQKDLLNGNLIIHLDLYISKERVESVVKTKLLYTEGKIDFQIKAEDARQFKAEALLQIATKVAESKDWQGIFECDPLNLERTTYYSTKAEAVKHVPTHVSPKDCFVWGSGKQWMVIPGTGCAHWVAHQKGIHNGAGCYTGNSIRVKDVVSGKNKYSIAKASVGDIWTNTDLSHCGIVREVKSGSVKVQHCSSGSGGVVYSNFTSGYCYRSESRFVYNKPMGCYFSPTCLVSVSEVHLGANETILGVGQIGPFSGQGVASYSIKAEIIGTNVLKVYPEFISWMPISKDPHLTGTVNVIIQQK